MNRTLVTVLVCLVLSGCSGIKPYTPPNHREEGPPGGLFSGPSGEWSIGIGIGRSTEEKGESQ